jgi:hypothetical protein
MVVRSGRKVPSFPLRLQPELYEAADGFDGTTDDRLGCPHEWEVAMTRYYFHLQADDQIVPDDEGEDLPDLCAAEHKAILAARELVAEAIKSGSPEVPEAFVIADEEGRALALVPFTTVLPRPLRK